MHVPHVAEDTAPHNLEFIRQGGSTDPLPSSANLEPLLNSGLIRIK